VITMTVSGDRPGYLTETLDSWSAVRGLAQWSFRFVVEPGREEPRCRAVIEEFSRRRVARDVHLEVNDERRGVLANPHHALSGAFATGAGFVVLAEEDIVVADDVCEFLAAQPDDPEVLAVCAFSGLAAPQPPDVVADAPFSPWVWGTWADRWHGLLAPRWFDAARAPDGEGGNGFDFGIVRLQEAARLRVLAPLASRSDNIGREGGVHALPEEFDQTRAPTFALRRDPVRWRAAGRAVV
jgi:hypothetical protein